MDWLKGRIWSWITYGTEPYEVHQQRRLVVINVLITIVPIITIPYIALMLFADPAGLWLPALIITIMSFLFLATPFFHKISSSAGGIYNLSLWVAYGITISYLLGKESGVHFYFLVGAVSAMSILGVKINKLSLISISYGLISFVLVERGEMPSATYFILPIWLQTTFFYVSIIQSFISIFCVVYYAFSQAHRAEELLQKEYEYSERLLSAMMPQTIASQLKREPNKTIADSHDQVTILFCDIVGFTPIAARQSPEQIVELLSRLFTQFDEFARIHGIEKIKTVGDAYMVAGGLPDYQEDHASRVANMAFDMLAFAEQMTRDYGEQISLRIGIHSGPVIAGVIGTQKPFYDVWGDTVNMAARMESFGESGKIQISEATKALLEADFVIKKRGTVDIKGKGKVVTWNLIDRL